jgi:hypothetical protein
VLQERSQNPSANSFDEVIRGSVRVPRAPAKQGFTGVRRQT